MNSPERIAIVNRKTLPVWWSCKDISSNLAQMYRRAFKGKVKFFSIEVECDSDSTWKAASVWQVSREIAQFKPSRIVFIEHQPHPGLIIQALKVMYGLKKLPSIVAHIYGDFTINGKEWAKISPTIIDVPIKFICASKRQSKLLQNFISNTNCLSVLPFPVDTNDFYFSPKARINMRERIGLKENDYVLFYCGRISMQKNIKLMIEEFCSLVRKTPNAFLLIAGREDDLGAPLFGWEPKFGVYGNSLRAQISSYPSSIRSRIRFLGSVNRNTAFELYNAADAYLSLSLHHDEDYGMAVAEALCTGLPVCLTKWGGYAQFLNNSSGFAVDIGLNTNGIRINRNRLQEKLSELTGISQSIEERKKSSDVNLAMYSLDVVGKKLKKIHQEKFDAFQGFSHALSQLAFYQHAVTVPFTDGPKKSEFYEVVYSSYINEGEVHV